MITTQYGNVYFCFGNPRPGGRTGHGALLVMKPGFELNADAIHDLTDDKVAYYYSLYPDVTPDVIAGASKTDLLTKCYPAYCVTSAEGDIQMRGRSGIIMNKALAEKKEQKRLLKLAADLETQAADPAHQEQAEALLAQAEEYKQQAAAIHPEFETGNLTDLMVDMPSRSDEGARYFAAGQFDALVKIPVKSSEVDRLVRYLKYTETNIDWTMFGKGTSTIEPQNCCSAIVCGLGLAKMNVRPRSGYSPVSNHVDKTAKLTAWAAYFAVLLYKRNDAFSMDIDNNKLLLLPLAYAAVRFGMAMKHVNPFYQTVVPMMKDPENPGIKTQFFLRGAIGLLNAALCLTSTNPAVSNIISPTQLYATLKKQPGAEVIKIDRQPEVAPATACTTGR